MIDFNALKVAFFGERTNTDDAVKYASQIAGAEGVTSAMVMYNTLLNQLHESTKVERDADHIVSVTLSCGSHTLPNDEQTKKALEVIQNRRYGHNFAIKNVGAGYIEIYLRLDKYSLNRVQKRI